MMRYRTLLIAGLATWMFTLAAESAVAAPCWRPPVSGQVVDHFRSPWCPYCAGNRGIEYRTDGSVVVRSVQAGRVVFSGSVGGTRYVVIDHRNGWKLTYGRLSETELRRGEVVVSGAVVGSVDGSFHFGLRVNGSYRDPAPYIGRLDRSTSTRADRRHSASPSARAGLVVWSVATACGVIGTPVA